MGGEGGSPQLLALGRLVLCAQDDVRLPLPIPAGPSTPRGPGLWIAGALQGSGQQPNELLTKIFMVDQDAMGFAQLLKLMLPTVEHVQHQGVRGAGHAHAQGLRYT